MWRPVTLLKMTHRERPSVPTFQRPDFQCMSLSTRSDPRIYLGIDWATDKHGLCLVAEDGRILSEFQISHDLAGFQQMHAQVQALGLVAVYIERSDGLLVEWMLAHGYRAYVTPPNVLAHRRPRRAKDDRGDAYLLAYLLWVGDPYARPLYRQSAAVMHLKQLAATYDLVAHEQPQLGNRLIYALRQYYPAVPNPAPIAP